MSTSYRPIKQLLLLHLVPPSVKLKLLNLVGHLESDYSGFTCLDMFVIRHAHIVQVPLRLRCHAIRGFKIHFDRLIPQFYPLQTCRSV